MMLNFRRICWSRATLWKVFRACAIRTNSLLRKRLKCHQPTDTRPALANSVRVRAHRIQGAGLKSKFRCITVSIHIPGRNELLGTFLKNALRWMHHRVSTELDLTYDKLSCNAGDLADPRSSTWRGISPQATHTLSYHAWEGTTEHGT